MAAHNQASLEDSSTRPIGILYGGGIGSRHQYYEFELNFSKGSLATDIKHDGQSNTLVHDQSQFTLALNFYLVRFLYARIGYALSIIEQSTTKKVTGASGEGLQKEYGLKDTKDTGLVLGAGWVFPLGKLSVYVQYEYVSLNEVKGTQHIGSSGIRWYF